MKTDERRLAWAYKEVYRWALVHDMIAHPLMALFGYSRWTRRFHRWTSDKAWPAARPPQPKRALVAPVINRFRRNG